MTSTISTIITFATLVVVANGLTRLLVQPRDWVCIGGSKTSVIVGPCVVLDGEHFSNASFEVEFLKKTEKDGSTAVAIGFQNTFKDGYVMGPKEPFEMPGKLRLVPFVNQPHQYWTKGTRGEDFLIRNAFNNLYLDMDDSWVYQSKQGREFRILPCRDCNDDFGQDEPFKSAEECMSRSSFSYHLKAKGCMEGPWGGEVTFGLPCISGHQRFWSAVNVNFSNEGINYFAISNDGGYGPTCLTSVDVSGGGVQFVVESCRKENHAQLWQFVDGPTLFSFGLRQLKSMKCIQPGKPGDYPLLEPCDANNTDVFRGIRCAPNALIP